MDVTIHVPLVVGVFLTYSSIPIGHPHTMDDWLAVGALKSRR